MRCFAACHSGTENDLISVRRHLRFASAVVLIALVMPGGRAHKIPADWIHAWKTLLTCVLAQVLLVENDINTSPFSPAVHACVPPLPWTVTSADVEDPNRCQWSNRTIRRRKRPTVGGHYSMQVHAIPAHSSAYLRNLA